MVRLASEYLGTISLVMVTVLIGWVIHLVVRQRLLREDTETRRQLNGPSAR